MDADTERRFIAITVVGLLALGAGAGIALFGSSGKADGRLVAGIAPEDSSVAATGRGTQTAESKVAPIVRVPSVGLAPEGAEKLRATATHPEPTALSRQSRKGDGAHPASAAKALSRTPGGRAIENRSEPDVADAAAGSGYRPMPIRQAIDPDGLAGVVLNHAGDLAFRYQPEAYPQGAMRLLNASGGAVAVSFHGEGAATVRLNGQMVQEGVRYLVAGDAEIRGATAVGVHVRSPQAGDSLPAPVGAG